MTFAFNIDDWNFREAPALCCNDEFIKTFAVYSLWSALEDFGCGPFEQSGVIDWYWRTAPTWPKKATTQIEFDKYARQRVSDRVGYTRRYSEACGVIDRLYDKARGIGVECSEVIDAIAFLAKPEVLLDSRCQQNEETTLIDMTKRCDFPRVLKVDSSFLPVLRRLWPIDIVRVGHKDVVMKRIPVGSVVRDFPLYKLVFWQAHPTVGRVELDDAVESHNDDPLDLRAENLFSLWEERAKQDASGTPAELPEGFGAGGRRFLLRENNGGRSRKRAA